MWCLFITLWKTNMEATHEGLEDDFCFQRPKTIQTARWKQTSNSVFTSLIITPPLLEVKKFQIGDTFCRGIVEFDCNCAKMSLCYLPPTMVASYHFQLGVLPMEGLFLWWKVQDLCVSRKTHRDLAQKRAGGEWEYRPGWEVCIQTVDFWKVELFN